MIEYVQERFERSHNLNQRRLVESHFASATCNLEYPHKLLE